MNIHQQLSVISWGVLHAATASLAAGIAAGYGPLFGQLFVGRSTHPG
jgi:hypothetical protein